MKRDLAPMLFKDDDPAAAAAERSSPVAKAKVSPAARQKALRKRPEVRLARPQLPHPPAGPRQPDPQQRPLRRRTPHNDPVKTNAHPDPRFQSPPPQDRRVGSTRCAHRVTSRTCAQYSRKFGLGRNPIGPRNAPNRRAPNVHQYSLEHGWIGGREKRR
jgi:hypothetical protein